VIADRDREMLLEQDSWERYENAAKDGHPSPTSRETFYYVGPITRDLLPRRSRDRECIENRESSFRSNRVIRNSRRDQARIACVIEEGKKKRVASFEKWYETFATAEEDRKIGTA